MTYLNNNDNLERNTQNRKQELRLNQLKRRASLSIPEVIKASECVFFSLFHFLSDYNYHKVLLYSDFRNEIQTNQMAIRLRNEGKHTYYPKVDGHTMDFFSVSSPEDLKKGTYGISEPMPKCSLFSPMNGENDDSVIMLLPGVVFDLHGNRIGYGGGYYDRYLSEYSGSKLLTIALAYDFQLQDEIMGMESHDHKVDCIITDCRTILCE